MRVTKPKYLERDEVHELIAACRTERDGMLIDFLYHTGARISEALEIRKRDIKPSSVHLRNLKQRDDEADKYVILGDAAFLSRLNSYVAGLKQDDFLFTGATDTEPMTRQRAWQIVKQAGRDAGLSLQKHHRNIAPWPHTLRHSFAVLYVSSGVPLPIIRDQLGHADLNSTQIYLDIADPYKEKVITGVQF